MTDKEYQHALDLFEKGIRADERAKVIDKYKLKLLEEFDLYEHKHGYPCIADINEILNDVAEQLKENSNEH